MAYTDVLQLGLILVGLGIALPWVIETAGGVGALAGSATAPGEALGGFGSPREAASYADWTIILVLGGIPWNVYFQRVLASRNPGSAARQSMLAGVLCAILAILLSGGRFIVVYSAVIGGTMLYLFGLRPVTVLVLRLKRSRPHRWHLPLPMPPATDASARKVTGSARPCGDQITAPFSRKPCLAYEICILFDAAGDARPPEWVLQEARGVDFQVDDVEVPGQRVLVRTPLENYRAMIETIHQRGTYPIDIPEDVPEPHWSPA